MPTVSVSLKNCRWYLVASLLLLGLLFPETARAQVEDCDCINCPQFLPDLSNTDFYIEIQNATNQTMGQNGQGLCGVRVHFDHTALCDLRITLTAPSGQSVVLIGPSFKHPDCFYLCTQGTSWDVTFLPCGDPDVAPDPGFSEQWTNVQVWGTNNFFTGSYYPFQGCLQNLTGPVNGTWTLNVFDGLGADVGNLITFELIFCDPTGINCFNCVAEAGNLNQPDVVVCARSQEAVLSLPPTYVPPVFAPPPADYSYGYVVANADGVIEGILPEPDLSGFPEGVYTVCGLSHHNLALPYIPAPDGVLTVQTLRDQLNALGPPFCGDISVNCVGVRIKPTPEDVEETATICGPACYEFFDQIFCQTGTYTLNLKEDGCSYSATLNLTVNLPSTTSLSEVVCAPACSANPLFPQACATGAYTAYLENSLGCDSVVVLNLTVNAVQATIQDPPLLDCGVPSVVLSGAGSSTGNGVAYLWTAFQGGHIVGPVDGINAVADSTGTYALQVCRTLSGLTCCDTAIASVAGSTAPPPAPIALLGDTLICLDSIVRFSLAPVPGAAQYAWTADPAAHIDIAPDGTMAMLTAQDTGTFTLCVAAENACGSGPPVCLSVTVLGVPAAPVVQGDTMACMGDTALYILGSPAGVQGYTWSVNGGAILFVSPGSDSLWVVWPDTGSVSVCVTPKGACGEGPAACREVLVLPIPEAHAGIDTAVCGLTLTLSALPGYPGVWESLTGGGAAMFSDSTAPDATATAPSAGDYRFAWRASNGVCADTDTVSVRFNPIPSTGPVTITCDDTNTQYTVSFTLQQGTPPYAVPGGTMTGSVFTSDPLASGVPYAFGVVDAQGCRAAPVQGIHSCICTSFAGEMDQDTLMLCAGETAIAGHLGGAVQDGNDTTAYLLHSSSTTVVGMVYSMQASGAFGFQPGMQYGQTYYISLVVGNALNGLPDLSDPCLSVAPGQPVVFLEPPQAHAGMDTAVCGLSVGLSALTGAFPGVWSVQAGPGSLSFADSLEASTTATASAAGLYAVVWSVANGQCVDTDTLQLQFNEAPAVVDLQRVCDGTNATYTVVLSVTGGQPPYASTGLSGSFAGNTFTSDPLVSGSAFQLVISDSRGCRTDLSGQHVCGCTTFAGTLTAQDSIFCTTAPLRAQWDNNAVLDADDGIQFVLYAAAAGFPGGILAVSSAPEFFFGAGLQAGVPYYIVAVAGSLVGGSVSLSDPCLSVSPGVPVRWQEPPVANAGADQVLRCDEPEVVLSGTSSGGADTLKWYLGGQWVGSGATLVVRDTGFYALVAIHTVGCADTAWVRVTADVDVPTVGAVLVSGETCSGDGDGSILLEGVGGASPPILASLNGGPFEGQLYFGSLPPGVYTIRLRNSAGCLWQSDTLVVAPGSALSVSLGGDQEVSPGEVVVLQALVNGPADTLIWEPLLDSLQAQSGMQRIRLEQSLLIRLRVRSPEGCEAFDEVFIRVRAVEQGEAVYVPNVIQPGSAFNDVFTVFAGPDVERVGVLRIFDRWGGIVFEALDMAPNDPSVGWDGRIRGVQAPPGVYGYQAVVRFADGREKVLSGDVTVVR